jgi:hypothetical protein
MPFNGVENDEVLINNLQDYYATLADLVNKYAKTHLDKAAQKGE